MSQRRSHGRHRGHRSSTAASCGFVHVDGSGHAGLILRGGGLSSGLVTSPFHRSDHEMKEAGACGGVNSSQVRLWGRGLNRWARAAAGPGRTFSSRCRLVVRRRGHLLVGGAGGDAWCSSSGLRRA